MQLSKFPEAPSSISHFGFTGSEKTLEYENDRPEEDTLGVVDHE